jgi:hypothetical protein
MLAKPAEWRPVYLVPFARKAIKTNGRIHFVHATKKMFIIYLMKINARSLKYNISWVCITILYRRQPCTLAYWANLCLDSLILFIVFGVASFTLVQSLVDVRCWIDREMNPQNRTLFSRTRRRRRRVSLISMIAVDGPVLRIFGEEKR